MSDVFFANTDEIPLPPNEVRIRQLTAKPRPDGARIDVVFELTPFQRRPNLEVAITDAQGREVSALSIVEAIDHKMNFTMHLRHANTQGSYVLQLRVFYADVEAHQGSGTSAGEILGKARQVVDQREVSFNIPTAGVN